MSETQLPAPLEPNGVIEPVPVRLSNGDLCIHHPDECRIDDEWIESDVFDDVSDAR